MQLTELPIRIGEVVRDGSGGLAPAAPDLGLLEFEAADRLNADAMLSAGDRIDYGLAALIDVARHFQMGAALVDVHGEINVCENRIVDFRQHREVHLEVGRAGPGVLPTHDAQQAIALRVIGAPVDNGYRRAVAHMDRSRILVYAGDPQPVELRAAVKALIDLNSYYGPAVAVGRQGVELTRTTVGAIAVREFAAVDRPLRFGHCDLPMASINGEVELLAQQR